MFESDTDLADGIDRLCIRLKATIGFLCTLDKKFHRDRTAEVGIASGRECGHFENGLALHAKQTAAGVEQGYIGAGARQLCHCVCGFGKHVFAFVEQHDGTGSAQAIDHLFARLH